MTVIDRRYSVAEGNAFKAPCRVATTANITLGGLQSIDGVTVAEHDRILVKDQTDQTTNGIYEASTGNWRRAKDFDGAYDIVCGTKVYVTSGGEANTEYTVTSSDPITIGTSNITFEVAFDNILEDAEAAAALAAAAASALGNQAYTFDYYTQAEGASVPVGVQSIRLMGYYAAGDAPVASYYRVASQPSTTNRIRTTDRFLPNGSTSAGDGGWWQMVLDDFTDVRKYGVVSGATDRTTKLQGAITAGSIVIPAASSNYVLSDIITVPSDRDIWVRSGATIVNTGGRFSSNVPGGGNVHWRIDGVMAFLATNDAPIVATWGGGASPERGLIEFGGTIVAPAGHFSVTGKGKIYSDYVFIDAASTGISADIDFHLNRKGIAFFNCHDVLVDGLEVIGIYGEAIYHNGGSAGSSYNVQFSNNNVNNVAFDALNFNELYARENMVIRNNRAVNCFCGIEMSTGTADGNYIENCIAGIAFGGGGGVSGVIKVINNTVYSSQSDAYSLAFGFGNFSTVVVSGNTAFFAGAHGIVLDCIDGFVLTDNVITSHGTVAAGTAIAVRVNATSGRIDNNVVRTPGVHSTGNVVDGGGNSLGTNPVYV